MKTLIKLLVFSTITICIFNLNSYASEKIKIGLIVPLSGDNFLIGDYRDGFLIISRNLLEDKNRFMSFIPNSFIKIDIMLAIFIFIFLLILYSTKFYSYVNELNFTVDKGFLDEDGYLSIVGRSKDMIISGGLNVYPKEIESLIDDLEGVGESAVIGLKDDDLGEKVVAIVVRKEISEINEEVLISALKNNIAGFKVPKKIFFVEALPRNSMGKVQKNVLRDNYQ